MTGPDIWSKFAPSVVQYVETLLREGKIGICAGNIRITDLTTSTSTLTKEPCGDRFKIVIPYAGHSITWEILFNMHYPEDPPDFIFGPDDRGFLPNLENIETLVNWNPQNPKQLLLVVRELLEHYKLYQQRLIDSNSRLQFEYSSLIDQAHYNPDDIEVHLIKRNDYKIGPINFLIKLPIDFKRIPAYLTKDNPGEDSAILLVSFQSADGSKVTPQLYLSPRVEHTIGGSTGLRIPPFPKGGCLIDYVPNVCELLNNKVEQVLQGFDKRKEYIAAFLSHMGRSVIEYDTEGFSRISFLFEWNDFFFNITIDLPLIFPIDQPVFTFRSVYHELKGLPFTAVVKEYPYSPRWTGNEMAERARAFFLDYVGTFQQQSISEGSF